MEKSNLVLKITKAMGLVASAIAILCMLYLSLSLHATHLVPTKFLVMAVVASLVILGGALLIVAKSSKPIWGVLGTILGIAVSVIAVLAVQRVKLAQETLKNIMDVHVETTQVSVYVFEDDKAQSIEEAIQYQFGVLTTLDRENTDQTIQQIREVCGSDIAITEYEGLTDLADAMMDREIQAMILNEGYVEILGEFEPDEEISTRDYITFAQSLRKLTEYTIEYVIEIPVEEVPVVSSEEESSSEEVSSEEVSEEIVESVEQVPEKKPTKPEKVQVENVEPIEPIVEAPRYVRDDFSYVDTGCFIVYISGNDKWGGLSSRSRSDVNILAVVNTKRKQILLVSTPRDYYVPLSISKGKKDKLTHAGIYGIQCSQDTLSMLYGVDVNYHFRLNFSGFEAIINALGGITVWSDYDFTVEPIKHYVVGNNDLNGIEALAFARERYALPGGDNARGRNQMNVIISVANKMCSSAVLTNYRAILDSVNGMFETNIPYDVLASMVQDQLGSGGNWDIRSYSVYGSGSKEYTYSISSQRAYVMIPNMDSVAEAQRQINACLDGTL